MTNFDNDHPDRWCNHCDRTEEDGRCATGDGPCHLDMFNFDSSGFDFPEDADEVDLDINTEENTDE